MLQSPSQKSKEKSLSIVIPTTDIKGEKNLVQICDLLDSIENGKIDQHCYIIVVFDKCSELFIEKILSTYSFVLPLINKRNRLHFARNSNLGLRYAHKELGTDVILCNQDCILPSWEYLSKLPGEGIATPTSIPQYEGMDLNKSQAPEYKRIEVKEKFPFYCVFIAKEVMDKIGYLDGVFCKPTFEDDDYLTRALLAGVVCFKTNIVISHQGSHIDTSKEWESASGSYTNKDLGQNLMKFGTKYQVPQNISHEGMTPWILENHSWTEEMKVW